MNWVGANFELVGGVKQIDEKKQQFLIRAAQAQKNVEYNMSKFFEE
ncbi:hypothetical protein K9L67_02145 [Candidatus Woesearchaeota archaeon]|nr:hypothetical protein [Candidatus Woesearchaeota archaeon]MCF7901005.1 hypothetical protein [Candidatus Woesearchaeota archaeon]MCF8013279.1 hypothetical protein [Candidatus Woesearchaeota archaeon]